MKKGVETNQKVQSRRTINLVESFMTIFNKKTEDYEIFRINKTGKLQTLRCEITELSFRSCRQEKVYQTQEL